MLMKNQYLLTDVNTLKTESLLILLYIQNYKQQLNCNTYVTGLCMSPHLITRGFELPADSVDQPAREPIAKQDDYKDEEDQEASFEEIKGPQGRKDFQACVIQLPNFIDLAHIFAFSVGYKQKSLW